jgi:hypothetical protein
MDIDVLVNQIGPFVTAAVAKWGDAALTKAEDTAATEMARLGQRLLARLFARAKSTEPIKTAVTDLAASVEDPDFQAALRAQIKKALREDDTLAAELAEMILQGDGQAVAASERGIAVGGDSSGINSSGDGAVNIQRR